MSARSIYVFITVMWVLILAGGGLAVLVLGPIEISGYGEYDGIISSGFKAVVAILLTILWVWILVRIKNWMFRKRIRA